MTESASARSFRDPLHRAHGHPLGWPASLDQRPVSARVDVEAVGREVLRSAVLGLEGA